MEEKIETQTQFNTPVERMVVASNALALGGMGTLKITPQFQEILQQWVWGEKSLEEVNSAMAEHLRPDPSIGLARQTSVTRNPYDNSLKSGVVFGLHGDKITWRALQLQHNPVKGNGDLEHLRQVHQHLVQDVEGANAGLFRKADILEQLDFEDPRPPLDVKPVLATELSQFNRADGFRNVTPGKFSDAASAMIVSIVEKHPFTAHNYPAAAEFIREVAVQAGYSVNWGIVNNEHLAETIRNAETKHSTVKLSAFIDRATIRTDSYRMEGSEQSRARTATSRTQSSSASQRASQQQQNSFAQAEASGAMSFGKGGHKH